MATFIISKSLRVLIELCNTKTYKHINFLNRVIGISVVDILYEVEA